MEIDIHFYSYLADFIIADYEKKSKSSHVVFPGYKVVKHLLPMVTYVSGFSKLHIYLSQFSICF